MGDWDYINEHWGHNDDGLPNFLGIRSDPTIRDDKTNEMKNTSQMSNYEGKGEYVFGNIDWFDERKNFGFITSIYGNSHFFHGSNTSGFENKNGTLVKLKSNLSSKGLIAKNICKVNDQEDKIKAEVYLHLFQIETLIEKLKIEYIKWASAAAEAVATKLVRAHYDKMSRDSLRQVKGILDEINEAIVIEEFSDLDLLSIENWKPTVEFNTPKLPKSGLEHALTFKALMQSLKISTFFEENYGVTVDLKLFFETNYPKSLKDINYSIITAIMNNGYVRIKAKDCEFIKTEKDREKELVIDSWKDILKNSD
jgi:cold shock CspA family protein